MKKTLPIEAIKSEFIQSLKKHSTLILSAPPGAGKSTGLPLWLLEDAIISSQKIYLLQPRRIAAKNIACYLSNQVGEKVGGKVGYRLRNESKVSKSTVLEVITEGILTQIIQNDPELTGVGLVIIDEFHERSLNADLAFALTRDVQLGLRDDLKLVIMSATLATNALQKHLPEAKVLQSEGRSFPVEISYQAPKTGELWRNHLVKVIQTQLNANHKAILVFLPGVADIHFATKALNQNLPDHVVLCPLFGGLTIEQQQKAMSPLSDNNKCKLVLSTNIAETSLTIEGVTLVIDSGLEKVALYDEKSMTNRLKQQAISKASATQRAGRAGRIEAGHCIRLYSREDFNRRQEHHTSEIQQADLLPLAIESARWGVTNFCELSLIHI